MPRATRPSKVSAARARGLTAGKPRRSPCAALRIPSRVGIDEADSCKAAEARFRAARPDVAVLDYRLPDGNALELILGRLLANGRNRQKQAVGG